jgi:UDP-N-acetylmuramate--alanine ligase
VGGTVKDLGGSNAHAGKDKQFVIEADEYDRMFLGLSPDVIVVTYLEYDHPDCFPTPEDYVAAFEEFVGRLRRGGVLLTAHDNPAARALGQAAPRDTLALTYGTSGEADYVARGMTPNDRGGFDYDAFWKEENGAYSFLTRVSLQVPGEHNARNSLAALGAVHQILPAAGLAENMHRAATALGQFSGTGRRFDLLGELDGIAVINDYAHHPTEIQVNLAAARIRYPQRRIWAVWQPHTFSRTQTLLAEFARAFADADRVLVTEVYAARENAADFNNFSAAEVVRRMDHSGAQFVPGLEQVYQLLLKELQPGDVLLVFSAGDADQVSAQVISALEERKDNHA